MGMNWAEHTTEIDAPIETSFDAIVDYESFPGWQDAVDSVEVLSRNADGIGENVRPPTDTHDCCADGLHCHVSSPNSCGLFKQRA